MLRKMRLLSSVLFVTPFVLSSNVFAADCVTQNCPTLGYTEASNTGNCVKCPFGNFWACPKIEEKAVLGQCTGYAKNCKIGDILNNDGTCTTNKESGKTPIGVVVYIGNDKCGEAIGLKIPQGISSGFRYGLDEEISNAMTSYGSTTTPNTNGKWHLPSYLAANSIENNYSLINSGLTNAGGYPFPDIPNNRQEGSYWKHESLEFLADQGIWNLKKHTSGGVNGSYYIDDTPYVRFAITF